MNLQIGNHLSIYWNWSPKFSPYFAESTILPKPEDKQLDIFLGKTFFFLNSIVNSEHMSSSSGRVSEFLNITQVVYIFTTRLRTVSFT